MMGQLKVQPGVPAGIRFLRMELRKALAGILEACEKMEFGGMVQCAKGVRDRKGILRGGYAGGGGP